MKKSILYVSVTLAILLSCKEKNNQAEKKIRAKTNQVAKKPEQKNQPQIQSVKTDLFPDVSLEKLPKTDSTNFDNFKQKNKLTDAEIAKLHLKKVNPNAENFYSRYKLSLSKDFETLAVTATSEMEMTTYLISYRKDYSIVDFLLITYDEIAESWMWTTCKIDKNIIKTEEHNEAGGEDEVTKETYIVKNGKFQKNK